MKRYVRYPNGWERIGNIVVFNKHWQKPAKTELWAFEQLIEKDSVEVNAQYFCFPWATLIDSMKSRSKIANELLKALENHPPRYNFKIITFCQHIYAMELMPYFEKIGITDLHWSHKTIELDVVGQIKIHPYPLYPVMHFKRKQPCKNKPLDKRKYLYSFIGAYDPNIYLAETRKWIFELPQRKDAVIKERSEWHFEQEVYRNQINNESETDIRKRIREANEQEYISVMEETVYCLCPSGSGPNSIRLWEAIEFGCMPIVLSDSLDLGILNSQSKKFIQLPEKKEAIIDFFEERSVSFR